ncbi:salicylate hydroxylase [Xylariomycetidae sp. FL2044]|nr:salicylate hydroxylase [Xylariomycetidae sp. FL2044]
MSDTIRVAITGGGLAGASLMHALLPQKHLDVHLFESAPEFKEAGAAIGIARNALAALDLIGPSAARALELAGAVPLRGVRFMLAQGPDSNSIIDEANDVVQGQRVASIVHRAAFLRDMLDGIPTQRLHASKKLLRVQGADREPTDDGALTLHFADDTTHKCDILIGADGIHSVVRKIILGDEDPAASPNNAGWWAVMALKPYADAYTAESSQQWYRTATAEEMQKPYQGWPEHLQKAIKELLCDQPQQPAIYLWNHAPARTYVQGAICMMGDAAHATTPWQGAGGGTSIEDSLILSTLLGMAKNKAEALVALRVYDRVRRPRTQRIVESSRQTGIIMTGKGEETKLDLGELKKKLLPRWDFIINFDNEKHRDEAKELMAG